MCAAAYNPREADEIHGYRGLDSDVMEKTASRTYFTPGETDRYTLPAMISKLVVFPHQCLPLVVNNRIAEGFEPEIVRVMLKQAKSKFPYFVSIYEEKHREYPDRVVTSTRGTLIYITKYLQVNINSLQIEGTATARVRIVDAIDANTNEGSHTFGVDVAFVNKVTVEILHEPTSLPSYYRNFVPHSILRRTMTTDRLSVVRNFTEPYINGLTIVSPLVLQQSELARAHAANLRYTHQNYPEKAKFVDRYNWSDQSYWCAQNFPFSSSDRKKLFDEDCTFYRHILINRMLEYGTYLMCGCGRPLCKKEDASAVMSVEGSSAIYVNRDGYLHDLIMLKRNFPGAILHQPFYVEDFSWFPGYKWSPATCGLCMLHCGWVFKSEHKTPSLFTVLTRGAARIDLEHHIPNEYDGLPIFQQ